MTLMIAGLLMWILVHFYPALFDNHRKALINTMGLKPYRTVFALLIVSSLVLIVLGWRSSTPEMIYAPNPGFRHPAMLLVAIGFIFLVAAKFPATRIKRFMRHPQLTGILLWSIAHLMANGDSKSIVLFTTLGVWSLAEMYLINRREGKWQPPEAYMSPIKEVLIPIIALVLVGLIVKFHYYIAGIPLINMTA